MIQLDMAEKIFYLEKAIPLNSRKEGQALNISSQQNFVINCSRHAENGDSICVAY